MAILTTTKTIESGMTLQQLEAFYIREKTFTSERGISWPVDSMTTANLKQTVLNLYDKGLHLSKGYRVFLFMYCYRTRTTSLTIK